MGHASLPPRFWVVEIAARNTHLGQALIPPRYHHHEFSSHIDIDEFMIEIEPFQTTEIQ